MTNEDACGTSGEPSMRRTRSELLLQIELSEKHLSAKQNSLLNAFSTMLFWVLPRGRLILGAARYDIGGCE